MTAWWGYVRLDAARALTNNERTKLLQACRAIGTASSQYPGKIASARASLNNDQFIVETDFPNGLPTRSQFVNALATELGVSVATVNALLTGIGLFGGASSTHEESADACRTYLAANIALWETAPA